MDTIVHQDWLARWFAEKYPKKRNSSLCPKTRREYLEALDIRPWNGLVSLAVVRERIEAHNRKDVCYECSESKGLCAQAAGPQKSGPSGDVG